MPARQAAAGAAPIAAGAARPNYIAQTVRFNVAVQVRPHCRQEVFRADVEAADDARLNWRLFKACEADAATFCSSREYGTPEFQRCLEAHRYRSGFSNNCRRAASCLQPAPRRAGACGARTALGTC